MALASFVHIRGWLSMHGITKILPVAVALTSLYFPILFLWCCPALFHKSQGAPRPNVLVFSRAGSRGVVFQHRAFDLFTILIIAHVAALRSTSNPFIEGSTQALSRIQFARRPYLAQVKLPHLAHSQRLLQAPPVDQESHIFVSCPVVRPVG